ncbi:hypothetical protein [Geodermatophilus sp. CPCC 206100]|uniref:hypothetical protein n=1 Tax=Geodermatophilus sp. CPCC 206100 TaxID=3020054 RepID=UPI003B00E3C9
MRAGRAVVPAALTLLLSGCVAPASSAFGAVPACSIGDDGKAASGVLLMAQSVPTATRVPCIRGLPLGWHFSGLEARNGQAAFSLDSDRDGEHAIEVLLTADCDTEGATEIRSDRDGMQRLERVTEVTPQYLGRRFYLFTGGCMTMTFTLSGDNRGEPLALATQGIGVLRRDELDDQVREESDGRLRLDPPAEAGDPG